MLLGEAIELDVSRAVTGVVEGFKGPIGIICAYEDSAQATKLALEFDKNNKNFNVTVGITWMVARLRKSSWKHSLLITK